MTNEEIEKLIRETEARHFDDELSSIGIREAVEQAYVIGQAQAYEEAYPLVCNYCADGLSVSHDPGGHYIHVVPTAMFVGPDYEGEMTLDMPVGCRAAKLRALTASLVQEPVAST